MIGQAEHIERKLAAAQAGGDNAFAVLGNLDAASGAGADGFLGNEIPRLGVQDQQFLGIDADEKSAIGRIFHAQEAAVTRFLFRLAGRSVVEPQGFFVGIDQGLAVGRQGGREGKTSLGLQGNFADRQIQDEGSVRVHERKRFAILRKRERAGDWAWEFFLIQHIPLGAIEKCEMIAAGNQRVPLGRECEGAYGALVVNRLE